VYVHYFEKPSLKWPILCWVRHKTHSLSVSVRLSVSHFVSVCCSEKDYTDAMSDDEALSGLGSVSEDIEGTSAFDACLIATHLFTDFLCCCYRQL